MMRWYSRDKFDAERPELLAKVFALECRISQAEA